MLSAFFSRLEAQGLNLNFFHLSKQDGLSDNSINSIAIDKDGFVWFGTNVGLNRYDGNHFYTYYSGDSKNSIPDNNVDNVFYSKSEELWISTRNNGVSLYNPISEDFTNYNFFSNNHAERVNETVGFAEDSDSVLFVATKDGVFYKYYSDTSFNEIPIINNSNIDTKEKGVLLNKAIGAITVDEKFGVWIIYENWDITYYHHKKGIVKHYKIDPNKNPFEIASISSAIHINGKLWVGTFSYALICFDPFKVEYSQPLKEENIVSFYQLSPGKEKNIIWMATSDGLMRFNVETNKLSRYTSMWMDNSSLVSTPISYIYEAKNNMIWVGSFNAGVNYAYLDRPFRHIHFNTSETYALSEESATDIMHDSYGNTWFGYIGGTIEIFNSETKTKSKIPILSLTDPWPPGTIFKLFQDSKDDIYACSWRGGVQKFDVAKSRFIPITGSSESFLKLFSWTDFRDIEEDSNGNLWLAAHGNGVSIYNTSDGTVKKINGDSGLSNNWVFDIAIDSNDNVWVGTAWGLTKINAVTNKIQNYYSQVSDTTTLSDNLAEYVTISDDGNVWVGTQTGLNLYDAKQDNFHRFGKENGLNETFIRSLEQDNNGIYWVSTSNGIIKFTLKETANGLPYLGNVHSFNILDGLQSDYYNLSGSSKDGNGYIFFTSRKGIDFFDPESIKPVIEEAKLKIVHYKIFGKDVYPGSSTGPPINKDGVILLNYKQNILDFEYTAIHFSNTEKDEYSYKISPLHSNWINVGNSRNIHLSNLKPGTYTLSLKVNTFKGVAGTNEDIITFYIKPPFWETLAFRIFFVLFIFATLIFSTYIYTYNLRRKRILLEKIVHQRTRELKLNNEKLQEQSGYLNETNTLLEERQQHIEEQAEELKSQSEELAKTNYNLEKLIAMKDKFFSIIAHDLKNPFNTIIGFSRLLKQNFPSYTNEKRIQIIDYIDTSASNVYSLLENLLNWSRSQTNRLEINPKYLLIEDIIDINHSLLSATLNKKGIVFSANFNKNIKVWADEELLNTIFRNILSNAAKFTTKGGKITVNIVTTDNNYILTEIKDTGEGMTEEELENLFKIDYSITRPGTSGESGTGLGMILCKEFVEKLKGEIWVKSEESVGTSVFFTIPTNPE